MRKVLIIARSEYLTAVRSKAFIVGILMLPLFMFGSVAIQHVMRDRVDTRARRFAVADYTGQLFGVIKDQARLRNGMEPAGLSGGKRRQTRAIFQPEEVDCHGQDPAALELILSERVRKGDLFAFLIIHEHALASEPLLRGRIAYHTDTPTYTELPGWLEQVINEEIQRVRLEASGFDQALIHRLTQHTPMDKLGLSKRAADGQLVKAKRENQVATFAVPFGSMLLLFMLVMSSTPALLNTVLEEKMQKIAEVLVSAVSPFQLLLGKLIGAMSVSLTLAALYLSAIAFSVWRFGVSDLIPPSLYLWFLLFQLLALMMFGSVFSAIGAACNEIRDAQSMMLPATFFVMVPMFVWMPVLQSPNSVFARLLSLFPPVTPMLMLLRIAARPGPPWWEICLGILLTTGFMLGCVWAGGKIFRIGLLAQGQPPSMRRMLQWLRSS